MRTDVWAYGAALGSCVLFCLNGELLQALQRNGEGGHASPLLNLVFCHLGGLLLVPHFGCAKEPKEPSAKRAAHVELWALLFALVLMGYNYAWLSSAALVELSLTNAVFQTSVALVYICSVQLFGEAVSGDRVVGVVLALTGSFLASGTKPGPDSHFAHLGGLFLALLAAVGYTAYQVLFRWLFGKQSAAFLAHFFAWVSLWHLLVILPGVCLAHLAGLENLQLPHGRAALGTLVSALLASAVNVLYLCIVMWGSPMLLPGTSALSVPLTVFLDLALHQKQPELQELLGQLLVLVSVVLIMQLHKVVLPSSFNLKGELMSL
ncbi:unnamed protein product [Effrenium voratum]|uniref:EamA domain-containing protein n=1 Tax=Effrenium voratum TaxID=2562239 RepID=A0AA36JKD0_9DINO|nr:unnamed protein product [Effrenium voratum]CAJ1433010.1 unnamed protein product [Effrenium voratum]